MKCPKCKSIWVCWNWCNSTSGEWLHECWNCSHCFVTKSKKFFGVPYFILKNLAETFVESGLYEKNRVMDGVYDYSEPEKKKE